MEDMAQPTQTDPQFKLRLPADLKDRLQRAAERNNRSMNSEIVAALEEKFPKPDLFGLLDVAVIEASDRIRKMPPGPEKEFAYKKFNEQLARAHSALGEIEDQIADALSAEPDPKPRQLKRPPKK